MLQLPSITALMAEYATALEYTDQLWKDLSEEEVTWRPHENSSSIGWHLGHQPVVAHFMVRNLTAAEPTIDARFDAMMDGATAEPERDPMPPLHIIEKFRSDVAARVRFRVGNINRGHVGAPTQLRSIATVMMTSIINHEYQHSQWIGEARRDEFGKDMPDVPTSDLLSELDGYPIIQLGKVG